MEMEKILGLTPWIIGGTIILMIMISVLQSSKMKYAFGVNRAITERRVIALTYDDGPLPPYTLDLLKLFDRYQTKATFFEVGHRMQEYPEVTQAVIEKGHELGNHSFSHQDMLFKSIDFIQTEIKSTDQLLQSYGVSYPIHFRPPWGRRFVMLPYQIWRMQKKLIMWDIDSKDYEVNYTPQMIAQQVTNRVRPGSIVVLHDGGGDRSRTVAATELILKKLTAQGYKFQTVSELINQVRVE